MVITGEKAGDQSAIYSVVKRAFAGAEHTDGNEQDLVNALRQSEAYIPELSLVAQIGAEIVGHILFTRAFVGDTAILALAPLSVLPEYQKRGVGTALIQEGHRIARRLHYGYSVVLGSAAYYPRFGYVPADTLGIQAPFDVPGENFMACRLLEGTSPVCGPVRYAGEFGIGDFI